MKLPKIARLDVMKSVPKKGHIDIGISFEVGRFSAIYMIAGAAAGLYLGRKLYKKQNLEVDV